MHHLFLLIDGRNARKPPLNTRSAPAASGNCKLRNSLCSSPKRFFIPQGDKYEWSGDFGFIQIRIKFSLYAFGSFTVSFCPKQRAASIQISQEVICLHISISKGNEKMGSIQSVSLPSGLTCRECPCIKKCYARRLERLRKSVRNAYQNNLRLLTEQPDLYWREVEAAVMLSRYFRFHVSGDIPSPEYLANMVHIASRNQHCQILCFTKRYEFVNDFLASGGSLPPNLHLIFSAWVGVPMENPNKLPEAHVLYRDGTSTASPAAVMCGGNCTTCALTDGGCWSLSNGEQVVFKEH